MSVACIHICTDYAPYPLASRHQRMSTPRAHSRTSSEDDVDMEALFEAGRQMQDGTTPCNDKEFVIEERCAAWKESLGLVGHANLSHTCMPTCGMIKICPFIYGCPLSGNIHACGSECDRNTDCANDGTSQCELIGCELPIRMMTVRVAYGRHVAISNSDDVREVTYFSSCKSARVRTTWRAEVTSIVSTLLCGEARVHCEKRKLIRAKFEFDKIVKRIHDRSLKSNLAPISPNKRMKRVKLLRREMLAKYGCRPLLHEFSNVVTIIMNMKTHLFDYQTQYQCDPVQFVMGALYTIGEGRAFNGVPIIIRSKHVARCLPASADLQVMGIKRGDITEGENMIKEAIRLACGQIPPIVLQDRVYAVV